MIHEASYKDSIDGILVFGVLHMLMNLWLFLPVFSKVQLNQQLFSSVIVLTLILVGFFYYRFRREKESFSYLIWRAGCMGLTLLSGLQFTFYSFYQSANFPVGFYLVLVFSLSVYVIFLVLRLFSDQLNHNAALEDGRFRVDGSMDFSVLYRPVPLPIPGYMEWRLKGLSAQRMAHSKLPGLVAIGVILSTPFMKSIVGAYLVGTLMAFMSYVYALMCLHCTLDILIYCQLCKKNKR